MSESDGKAIAAAFIGYILALLTFTWVVMSQHDRLAALEAAVARLEAEG